MDNIMDKTHTEPITIKIRAEQGCFCCSHSKETNRLIDEIVRNNVSAK